MHGQQARTEPPATTLGPGPAATHFPARYKLASADPLLQAGLTEATLLLQRVASVALSGLLAGIGADPRAVFSQYCDESGLPGWPDKSSQSVLNCYHYLNNRSGRTAAAATDPAAVPAKDPGGGDEGGGGDGGVGAQASRAAVPLPNCNEHTDPGFITVLGRGTARGLQMRHARKHGPRCTGDAAFHGAAEAAAAAGMAPGVPLEPALEPALPPFGPLATGAAATATETPATGTDPTALGAPEPAAAEAAAEANDSWVFVEPLMAANQVCVLVGESLYRGSGGVLPACLHRVVDCPTGEPRQNLIFELRPHTAVFGPLVPDPTVAVSAAAAAV